MFTLKEINNHSITYYALGNSFQHRLNYDESFKTRFHEVFKRDAENHEKAFINSEFNDIILSPNSEYNLYLNGILIENIYITK